MAALVREIHSLTNMAWCMRLRVCNAGRVALRRLRRGRACCSVAACRPARKSKVKVAPPRQVPGEPSREPSERGDGRERGAGARAASRVARRTGMCEGAYCVHINSLGNSYKHQAPVCSHTRPRQASDFCGCSFHFSLLAFGRSAGAADLDSGCCGLRGSRYEYVKRHGGLLGRNRM